MLAATGKSDITFSFLIHKVSFLICSSEPLAMMNVGSGAHGTAGHPSQSMTGSPATPQHHRQHQQIEIHIPLRSCRIWDCNHESKQATFISQVFHHRLIVTLLCESLPLIQARHRCLTFLRLRVVCRGLLVNVTFSMGKRCCMHIGRKAKDPVGWSQAVRILHSGCLNQFLVHWTQRRTPGGLWRDTTTGLPLAMKQAYFDMAVRKYGKLGWDNGRFVL